MKYFKKDQGVLFSSGVLTAVLFSWCTYFAIVPFLLLFILVYKKGTVEGKVRRMIRQGSFFLLGGLVVWALSLSIGCIG